MDHLSEGTDIIACSIPDVIVVDLPKIFLDQTKIQRSVASHFAPIGCHSFPFFLCSIPFGWLGLALWHICLLSLLAFLLFCQEDLEKLVKVKLKLVGISLLSFFESIHCHHVLTQTILYLSGQHELFFVKLKENLQLHEVLFVLLPFKLGCISIDPEAISILGLSCKNSLGCLHGFAVTLIIFYALLKLLLLVLFLNVFLTVQFLVNQLLNYRETLILLVPLLGPVDLHDFSFQILNFCITILIEVQLLLYTVKLLFGFQIVKVLFLVFGAHFLIFATQSFDRIISNLLQIFFDKFQLLIFCFFLVIENHRWLSIVIDHVLIVVEHALSSHSFLVCKRGFFCYETLSHVLFPIRWHDGLRLLNISGEDGLATHATLFM